MSRTVDRILTLHADDQRFAKFGIYVCSECGKTQPCPTIRTVESERILTLRRSEWYRSRRELRKNHTYHWISESEAVR
jgi:hypothetical protein